MKCKVVQRRLLSITNPEHVPANLRSHLARCGACREWHNQLIILERHIPVLPIPSSRGKAKLMRHLLREEVTAGNSTNPPPQTLLDSPTATIYDRPLNKSRSRSLILGVAAALLLIALGWLGLQSWLETTLARPSKPVADALLASLVERDLRLARAGTPRERIEILADVAEDLHGETNALARAASQEELTALANLYDEVVRQGILKQAQALPSGDRRRTLEPISLRMAQMASRVEQLVRELPAEFAKPLQAIAATAREAHRQLCALLPEGEA